MSDAERGATRRLILRRSEGGLRAACVEKLGRVQKSQICENARSFQRPKSSAIRSELATGRTEFWSEACPHGAREFFNTISPYWPKLRLGRMA